jgi:hypothetical protein
MRWWSCQNMGNTHVPLHVDPASNSSQGSSRSICIRSLWYILDLQLLCLSNPTNDSSHCDVSCMCKLFSGRDTFESLVNWMNRSAHRESCGDLVMSGSTTRQHPRNITRHSNRQHDLAASSPAWFSSDITPRPMLPQWCHRQHDLAAISCHHQCHLSSGIASMTRQRHHATDNVASLAPSLARLDSNVTP